MNVITNVQPYSGCKIVIYPALYKSLRRLIMHASKVKLRSKRRKLKRKNN